MEREQEQDPQTLTPTAKLWITLVGVLLVLWFLFAWLILDRHLLDAAGESVGTALALAVVVSVIGAVRSSR
jgi:glucan phosphoethanolaminetransferase (alkaline phosphatase superfamily)